MHVEPIPNPLLRFASDLPFFAFLVPLRDQVLREVVANVLHERAGLREHQRFGHGSRLNADDGRLAQRVDVLEVLRRHPVCSTLVGLDFVVATRALLQQPHNALRARLLEPVVVSLISAPIHAIWYLEHRPVKSYLWLLHSRFSHGNR